MTHSVRVDDIIAKIAVDDIDWIISEQQSNLTPHTKLRDFEYSISHTRDVWKRSKMMSIIEMTHHHLKTSLLLVAAYHGSPRCFDFFFANNQFDDCDARLHSFAYHSGNLHIINWVHFRYGVLPELFYCSVLSNHLSVYLFLTRAFDPENVIPHIRKVSRYLKSGIELDRLAPHHTFATLERIVLWLIRNAHFARVAAVFDFSPSLRHRLTELLFDLSPRSVLRWDWFVGVLMANRLGFWALLCDLARIETLHFVCDERVDLIIARFDDPAFPTILHYAAQCGGPDALRALICVEELDVNAPNARGECPIHIAIARANEEVIRVVLQHPMIVLSELPFVEPPLAAMLRAGFVMREFLRHRAVNLAEECGGKMVIAELAFGKGALLRRKFEALFAVGGEWRGLDINGIDASRKTLLHYAVEEDNLELVNLILGHPAFRPYLGRSADVLFAFFWLKSFCREIRS